tara:strand:+ start:1716 stop:2024 length:309 start_codon:yes stop_codon:yes gene_type:complete
MPLSLLKFSSEDCGTCHKMSHYDSKVAIDLGCEFINVLLQDAPQYRKYRQILLTLYPKKEGMGWPTYILVDNPDNDFKILGQLKGGIPKGDFRERLKALIDK